LLSRMEGTHMIADYCWSLKRDCPSKSHDRISL